MTDESRKTEPPLHLDMGFDEALKRFAQTDPAEVEPPKDKAPKVSKAAKRLASSGKNPKQERSDKRA
jgi:hypothetical protein